MKKNVVTLLFLFLVLLCDAQEWSLNAYQAEKKSREAEWDVWSGWSDPIDCNISISISPKEIVFHLPNVQVTYRIVEVISKAGNEWWWQCIDPEGKDCKISFYKTSFSKQIFVNYSLISLQYRLR